jgi:hypothetical protein
MQLDDHLPAGVSADGAGAELVVGFEEDTVAIILVAAADAVAADGIQGRANLQNIRNAIVQWLGEIMSGRTSFTAVAAAPRAKMAAAINVRRTVLVDDVSWLV